MNPMKSMIPLSLILLVLSGCSTSSRKTDAPEDCQVDHHDQSFDVRVDLSLDARPMYRWEGKVKEGFLSSIKENGAGPSYFPETSNFVSHKILFKRETAERKVISSSKLYVDWSLRALLHPNADVHTSGDYTVYEPETFSIAIEGEKIELNEHVSFERRTTQGVFVADMWTCSSQ